MSSNLVTRPVRLRPFTMDDLVEGMNREVIPWMTEMRSRFNEHLSPTTNAYTVTNPVDRRTFDTTTVTLPQLAEAVGTLIADLKTQKQVK